MKKYIFDLDETLCTCNAQNYGNARPYTDRIKEVNKLYNEGNEITIFTARGTGSKINWHETTLAQLSVWGVKYHRLIDSGKPTGDVFIDDKAMNTSDWVKSFKKKKIGFVASCFDLLHAGHCLMLKDAKSQCDHLIAALQTDPTIDRPHSKKKPIQSIEERRIQLESNKYVDEIHEYSSELDLLSLLSNLRPDIRILGSDWIGKDITGPNLTKEIYYHPRNHDWSTSYLKERIFNENCSI
jgi:glycerol-3-phosphate cytidylyltransferase